MGQFGVGLHLGGWDFRDQELPQEDGVPMSYQVSDPKAWRAWAWCFLR